MFGLGVIPQWNEPRDFIEQQRYQMSSQITSSCYFLIIICKNLLIILNCYIFDLNMPSRTEQYEELKRVAIKYFRRGVEDNIKMYVQLNTIIIIENGRRI